MASNRRKGLLPQTRALRHLQRKGWIADPIERKMGLVSKDWAGWADILAIRPEISEIKLIQVTSDSNFADRVTKVLDNDDAYRIAEHMPIVSIEVWGYRGKDPYKKGDVDPRYYVPYRVQKLVRATFRRRRLTRSAPEQ